MNYTTLATQTLNAVPALDGRLPPECQRDIDKLCSFALDTLEKGVPRDAVSPDKLRCVFLTGATGFLGRILLCELLSQNPDLVIYCLIRARDGDHARDRLIDAMREAEKLDAFDETRVRYVVGDICQPKFGLGQQEFHYLCENIEAVYHFAAGLELARSYASLRGTNVFSLKNVMELSLTHKFKHVYYAASMGIFPQYFARFTKEFSDKQISSQMQPEIEAMKRVFPIGLAGYSWSKLVAEQVLLFTQSLGLPLILFRIPVCCVSADTGYTQWKDLGTRMLSEVIRLKMAPGESGVLWREPASTICQIVVDISFNPNRSYTIYECCNPDPFVPDLDISDFGYDIRIVEYEEFKRAGLALGKESALAEFWPLLDFFAPYWFESDPPGSQLPVCDNAIRKDCRSTIDWPGILTIGSRSYFWIHRHVDDWKIFVPSGHLREDYLTKRAEVFCERLDVPLTDALPDWLRENLRILVNSIKSPEANVRVERHGQISLALGAQIHNRVKILHVLSKYPEIERIPIRRPVFIVGINRTGTTFLHRLLSQDSRFWVFFGHQLRYFRLPEDEHNRVTDEIVRQERLYFRDVAEATDAHKLFEGVHEYAENQAEEDFAPLMWSLACWVFPMFAYDIPEYAHHMSRFDSRKAYEIHRSTLQFHSWRRDPEVNRNWLLKMPLHLRELGALFSTYPDAIVIQTHRSPKEFMGSICSLVCRLREISVAEYCPHDIGQKQLGHISDTVNGAVRFRKEHPELENQWIDVNYYDFVVNPLETARQIYAQLGMEFDAKLQGTMEDWCLQHSQARNKEKRHKYSLEEFGLDTRQVKNEFEEYLGFIRSDRMKKRLNI